MFVQTLGYLVSCSGEWTWIQNLLIPHSMGQWGKPGSCPEEADCGEAKSIVTGVRETWVQILPLPHHDSVLGNWASLGLRLLICKWGITVIPTSFLIGKTNIKEHAWHSIQ